MGYIPNDKARKLGMGDYGDVSKGSSAQYNIDPEKYSQNFKRAFENYKSECPICKERHSNIKIVGNSCFH